MWVAYLERSRSAPIKSAFPSLFLLSRTPVADPTVVALRREQVDLRPIFVSLLLDEPVTNHPLKIFDETWIVQTEPHLLVGPPQMPGDSMQGPMRQSDFMTSAARHTPFYLERLVVSVKACSWDLLRVFFKRNGFEYYSS